MELKLGLELMLSMLLTPCREYLSGLRWLPMWAGRRGAHGRGTHRRRWSHKSGQDTCEDGLRRGVELWRLRWWSRPGIWPLRVLGVLSSGSLRRPLVLFQAGALKHLLPSSPLPLGGGGSPPFLYETWPGFSRCRFTAFAAPGPSLRAIFSLARESIIFPVIFCFVSGHGRRRIFRQGARKDTPHFFVIII